MKVGILACINMFVYICVQRVFKKFMGVFSMKKLCIDFKNIAPKSMCILIPFSMDFLECPYMWKL